MPQQASEAFDYAKKFLIPEDSKVDLKAWPTDYPDKPVKKEDGSKQLATDIERLSKLQDKFYAYNRYALLIVIQAMDAAGKDSTVKHVMSGLNPTGVDVTSFKQPTHQELEHDYLWRHYIALPARGMVGIFNRSHYENVLVTRVHPEFILAERIPGVESVDAIDKTFWEKRFKQINHFERSIAENGTVILKFFLHVSKKEQRKRFLERIDDPAKNWKFSAADLKERNCWKDYRKAYEDALGNTSKSWAPWYAIPADDKWFARLAVANIIASRMEALNLAYPVLTDAQQKELKESRAALTGEPEQTAGDPEGA